MVPEKVQQGERDLRPRPSGGAAARTNGLPGGQSWRVEKLRPIRARVAAADLPVWSGIGSVVLIVAVIFFEHPSMAKYALLFLAQVFYLLSILLRA